MARSTPWLSGRRCAALGVALAVILTAGILTAVRLNDDQTTVVVRAQILADGRPAPAMPGPAADPAGDGAAVCAPVSLAVAESPEHAAGPAVRAGVQRAVDRHNDANPGCQVQVKNVDRGGEVDATTALADVIADVYTIGLIAGTADDIGDAPRLATVSTSPASGIGGPGGTFEGVAGRAAQASAIARYIGSVARACVLGDDSAGSATLSAAVSATLGERAQSHCSDGAVSVEDTGAAATAIASAAPDAVFFGGSAAAGAALLTQLRERDVAGRFVLLDGSVVEDFVAAAGDVSLGTWLPRADGPPPDGFPAAREAVAYDLATVMLRGIDAGVLTRAEMMEWMSSYRGLGVTGEFDWAPDGALASPTVWVWEVR